MACFLAGAKRACAAASVLKGEATPGWVESVDFDLTAPSPTKGATESSVINLVDRQINVGEQTRYSHQVRRLITQSAIKDYARITVDFDPTYEQVSWHKLVVYRNGVAEDRLASQEIRTLSRESDLEENLYNGDLTAVLELQDLRVGDTVEFAYSVRGANPLFRGKYSEFIATTKEAPVQKLSIRVLCPKGRSLSFHENRPSLAQDEKRTATGEEFVWTGKDIPAERWETDQPSWESSSNWLQISEYKSWEEVVNWALGFYDIPTELPPNLKSIEEACRALPSDEKRIRTALEFVQDQIRYLSISEGVHSHEPYAVEEVVKRGFGDCKDKARVLTALLRKLGFDAAPALVNTSFRQAIAGWLPTPTAFDHVIVRLNWNGQTYWLDATDDHERGPLEGRFAGNYGWALVLAPGTKELTKIVPPKETTAKTLCQEKFDITAFDKPVLLEVVTEYRGSRADWMRADLDSESLDDLQKSYLNFYEGSFPGIQIDKPLEVEDDAEADVLKIRESYRVPKLWTESENNASKLYVDFYPHLLKDYLNAPSELRRTTSLRVKFPVKVSHVITIKFPDESTFSGEAKTITNPAFEYVYKAAQKGKVLTLSHSFESRQQTVAPSEMAAYASDLKAARSHLTYEISIPRHLVEAAKTEPRKEAAPAPERPPQGTNWLFVLYVVLTGLIFLAFTAVGYVWRPDWPAGNWIAEYDGIKGWLLMVGLGLIIRPVMGLMELAKFRPFFDWAAWSGALDPGHATLRRLVMLFDTTQVVGMVLLGGLLLVLFVQRRRTFPVLFVIYFAISLVIVLCDTAFTLALHMGKSGALRAETWASPLGNVLGASLVWIPYMLRSRRVKATFRR